MKLSDQKNVLLINRCYQEGSSLTLFIFSTVCCLLCMLYAARPHYSYSIPQLARPRFPLSLDSVLPKPPLSPSALSASPSHPPPSPLPLLSWDLAPVWFDVFGVPAGLNTPTPHCSFLPSCCLSYSAGIFLLWHQAGTPRLWDQGRDWI